jgi:hypothetical protein
MGGVHVDILDHVDFESLCPRQYQHDDQQQSR